ncbi:MAG: site-2 protease family protein, partial [Actinobacteria bacterium]|nr:site-2 protease family protein [Actinomycetota bacterium]
MRDVQTFLLLLPILLACLTLHELAHAYVATRFGDPTPREQGRLTLNPIPHVDPLGTITFVITYFLTPFLFGWAKPVEVQPHSFRRPKQHMAIVAAAGPATNFAVAIACAAVLVHGEVAVRAVDVVFQTYMLNLVLGIFNLLPIPP